jgi:hypothetical protein
MPAGRSPIPPRCISSSRCSPLTPEADLLRLAARVHLEPSHRDRLIARLSSPLDWPLLLHLIERHRLAPLVYAHLNALAPERVPRPILIELWRRFEHHARRNAQLRGCMIAAVRALADHGIPCIPYKGPVLAEMLYGDVGLRAFDDLDLLVRARDLERAKAVLADRGYERYYDIGSAAEQAMLDARLQYHVVLKGASPEHLLELHWKSDPLSPVERDEDASWQDGAFPAGQTLLLSAIHAMRHHGYRLCWIVDVAEQLRQNAPFDWPAIVSRARDVGARKRLSVALLMSRDVLDAPLPADVEQILRADRGVVMLAAQLTSRLFQRDTGQLSAAERTQIDLAMCDRFSDRLRFALALAFEPGLQDVAEWRLPRRLAPLYVPLRAARLLRKYAATRSWRTGRTAPGEPAGGAATPE